MDEVEVVRVDRSFQKPGGEGTQAQKPEGQEGARKVRVGWFVCLQGGETWKSLSAEGKTPGHGRDES